MLGFLTQIYLFSPLAIIISLSRRSDYFCVRIYYYIPYQDDVGKSLEASDVVNAYPADTRNLAGMPAAAAALSASWLITAVACALHPPSLAKPSPYAFRRCAKANRTRFGTVLPWDDHSCRSGPTTDRNWSRWPNSAHQQVLDPRYRGSRPRDLQLTVESGDYLPVWLRDQRKKPRR